MRNAFGSIRRFKSPDGVIKYDYIALQEDMGVRLANKLTKEHLHWTNMKMKVRLAAQMLSPVADALEYLLQTDDKFKDAGPTIQFIREVCIANVDLNIISNGCRLVQYTGEAHCIIFLLHFSVNIMFILVDRMPDLIVIENR